MSINSFIKSICQKLGENNKSIYPVIAIAAANGICRPTFTMLKKDENPESKKYAALREGLTEIIAIPTYWTCGELAAKFGRKIVSVSEGKKIAELEKQGKKFSQDEKLKMKSVAIKKGQSGLMLIGVCVAAGFVIPALCSLLVTPVMNKINKKPQNNVNQNMRKIVPPQKQIKRPVLNNMSFYGGMKVGGI